MFKTRLNPTKPPASHRAVLERVGAACRAVRAAVESEPVQATSFKDVGEAFARNGVFRIGVPEEFGGAGSAPLLIALAAERIGREGLRALCEWASHVTAAATIAHRGTQEQKERYLRAAAAGTQLSGMTLREIEASSGAVAEPGQASDESVVPTAAVLDFRLTMAAGWVGSMADCIEAAAEIIGAKPRPKVATEGDPHIDTFFAESATDMEAGRAIALAAAELKAEYDRRPTSKHLELEATTLVSEAFLFAERALDRMHARAAQTRVDDSSRMLDLLPPRHELTQPVESLPRLGPESLENLIARFYLYL